jgi:hypothetical protein
LTIIQQKETETPTPAKKELKNQKINGVIEMKKLFICILLLCPILCYGQSATPQKVKDLIERQNKSLPVMIDDYTRLDSFELIERKKLMISYTFPPIVKEKLGASALKLLQEELKSTMLANIKDTGAGNSMELFRALEYTIAFRFRDKNGKDLVRFEIYPKDYK